MPPINQKTRDRTADVRWEAEHKFSPEDAEAARQALKANAGKNFVQRITNASDWPVVQNPDGGYSSHRMANSGNYAYPTIFYNKDTNALYKPEDPMGEARRTGDFIELGSPEEAAKFAEGAYKVGMDTGLMQQMAAPSAGDPITEKLMRMWR